MESQKMRAFLEKAREYAQTKGFRPWLISLTYRRESPVGGFGETGASFSFWLSCGAENCVTVAVRVTAREIMAGDFLPATARLLREY